MAKSRSLRLFQGGRTVGGAASASALPVADAAASAGGSDAVSPTASAAMSPSSSLSASSSADGLREHAKMARVVRERLFDGQLPNVSSLAIANRHFDEAAEAESARLLAKFNALKAKRLADASRGALQLCRGAGGGGGLSCRSFFSLF